MRLIVLPVICLGLLSVCGCGQSEPDRYKTKSTERPTKGIEGAPAKDAPKPNGGAAAKPAEPAQEKQAEGPKAK
jgi:hypothetical protein